MYKHHLSIRIEELIASEIKAKDLEIKGLADFIDSDPLTYVGFLIGLKSKDKEKSLTSLDELKTFINKYKVILNSENNEIEEKILNDLNKILSTLS